MENNDSKYTGGRLNFRALVPQLTTKFKRMVANNEIEVADIFDVSEQAAKMLKNLIVDDVKNSGLSKLKKDSRDNGHTTQGKGFLRLF